LNSTRLSKTSAERNPISPHIQLRGSEDRVFCAWRRGELGTVGNGQRQEDSAITLDLSEVEDLALGV